jgi:hypothetical protein
LLHDVFPLRIELPDEVLKRMNRYFVQSHMVCHGADGIVKAVVKHQPWQGCRGSFRLLAARCREASGIDCRANPVRPVRFPKDADPTEVKIYFFAMFHHVPVFFADKSMIRPNQRCAKFGKLCAKFGMSLIVSGEENPIRGDSTYRNTAVKVPAPYKQHLPKRKNFCVQPVTDKQRG